MNSGVIIVIVVGLIAVIAIGREELRRRRARKQDAESRSDADDV
jgi:hypothetical protein